jgi:hypothetical protein
VAHRYIEDARISECFNIRLTQVINYPQLACSSHPERAVVCPSQPPDKTTAEDNAIGCSYLINKFKHGWLLICFRHCLSWKHLNTSAVPSAVISINGLHNSLPSHLDRDSGSSSILSSALSSASSSTEALLRLRLNTVYQMDPLRLAAASDPPVLVALSGFASPSVLTASLAAKLCSKSWIMSSMCSIPTEMRIMSSVTPESNRSCSDNCSCVVDQG